MVVVRPSTWIVCAALVCLVTVAVRAQVQNGLPVPHAKPPAAPTQPLPYSHRQHLELAIVECADCHVQPGDGTTMTFPDTDTCMSCHATQPATTAALKQLTAVAASGKPIPWVRVYQLPAYVYWSHASHLGGEITCANCHGAVEQIDAMRQETNVATKVGCVTCHETRQAPSDCGDCHEPRQ
jgi:hypothetical protein